MIEEIINREKNENEVNTMSPLIWAYVGDCVYELYIRMMLVNNTRLKPHMLHVNSIKYVKAESQAKILKDIEYYLTDQEIEIVRRGRNTKNHHIPKNASVEEYALATAFESLIGYLYLTKQEKRLKEILNKVVL